MNKRRETLEEGKKRATEANDQEKERRRGSRREESFDCFLTSFLRTRGGRDVSPLFKDLYPCLPFSSSSLSFQSGRVIFGLRVFAFPLPEKKKREDDDGFETLKQSHSDT